MPDIRVKFAIDYRRVNAVTIPDAGGLGTQADILYGVGGKFKYIGLCDAAGGLSPSPSRTSYETPSADSSPTPLED